MSRFIRWTRRQWPSLVVITYTVIGWPVGIVLLTRPEVGLNALGVLLTAHTLICSAYLIHDCAHNAIFASRTANDRLGVLMSWINGACLADYGRLQKKHLRHHSDRLDVVTFDYRGVLQSAPVWVRRGMLALEWAYVPAVELLMRGLVAAAPFRGGTRAPISCLSRCCVSWTRSSIPTSCSCRGPSPRRRWIRAAICVTSTKILTPIC